MFIRTFCNILRKRCLFPRTIHISSYRNQEDISDDIKDLITSGSEYEKLANHYFDIKDAYRCLIIQPYVKWGPKKLSISPKEQLSEAVALVRTLPNWSVEETIKIPLDNLERKALFKSGSMDRLRAIINTHSEIGAIFINSGNLKKITTQILEENFRKPVFDRYKIVMQILKAHATSKHAKLQVTLAELYYLQKKSEQDLLFKTYNPGILKLMFQDREKKIKKDINELRNQRHLLRNKRKKLEFPIVAVVGYTNAGKTSIIKALTGEKTLQPKDQLFATLDVTVHEGKLPSGLNILYVDTVGFISDIPTNLIECFVATLEDALLADVILHVEDISVISYHYKRKHVLDTLIKLGNDTNTKDILSKVISVGNKCDLVDIQNLDDKDIHLVSAEREVGLEELRLKLENFLLKATSRQKITIKIPNGGEEIRWLYKNATVVTEIPDENDVQFVLATVIITKANLQKFKHKYI